MIQTVIDTGILSLPLKHEYLKKAVGIELTTSLLIPIIPQLFTHYGNRNMTIVFNILQGT